MKKSRFLSKRSIKAFNRMGNIMMPKNGEFPKFSDYGGVEHIDKMLEYAPQADREDLDMLLTVLSFMPGFVLRFILWLCLRVSETKTPIFTLLRQLNLALRGMFFACYYAHRPGENYKGKDPCELIDFEINRVVD